MCTELLECLIRHEAAVIAKDTFSQQPDNATQLHPVSHAASQSHATLTRHGYYSNPDLTSSTDASLFSSPAARSGVGTLTFGMGGMGNASLPRLELLEGPVCGLPLPPAPRSPPPMCNEELGIRSGASGRR